MRIQQRRRLTKFKTVLLWINVLGVDNKDTSPTSALKETPKLYNYCIKLSKSNEPLEIQTKKQQHLLMKYVEGKGKETMMNSVAKEGTSNRNTVNDNTIDGNETLTKEVKNEGQTNKINGDEPLSDHNKFNKVDMSISGTDSNSWLFQADCYL